jgi:prophage maintenance system killer protein
MFCALNGHQLKVPLDEAVSTMLAVAAGEIDQAAVADWLTDQLDTNAP